MGKVVDIDAAQIEDQLGRIVRGTVEDTLNVLLDAEATRLLGGASIWPSKEISRHAQMSRR